MVAEGIEQPWNTNEAVTQLYVAASETNMVGLYIFEMSCITKRHSAKVRNLRFRYKEG